MDSEQDKLGMVIGDSVLFGELVNMQKQKYSDKYSNIKEKKSPSELIPKTEVEKAKKRPVFIEIYSRNDEPLNSVKSTPALCRCFLQKTK